METEKLKVKSSGGFTIYDEDTGSPVCVKSKSLTLLAMPGECGAATPPQESEPEFVPESEPELDTASSSP